ncbi:MAG: four helix bundle protein [Clostridiales bacterium]|nr:four helix bundle protein [Clostridiales bacterium]
MEENKKITSKASAPQSGAVAEEEKKLSANMQAKVDKLEKQLNSKITPQKPTIHLRKDASELIVISRTRDFVKYVINATRKIPKSERYSFAFRLQTLALNIIENMVRANNIIVKPKKIEQYKKRYEFQEKAMGDLKVLEYLVAIAVEEEFMLVKQFEQIAKQGTEISILLTKWIESDKRRFLANCQ